LDSFVGEGFGVSSVDVEEEIYRASSWRSYFSKITSQRDRRRQDILVHKFDILNITKASKIA